MEEGCETSFPFLGGSVRNGRRCVERYVLVRF